MATDEQSQAGKKKGREPITPAKRKRLEQQFEIATKKVASAETADDFLYATELFSQCVLGDPNKLDYVRGYVECQQKKYKNNRKGSPLARFRERGARSGLKKALSQENWDQVIAHGVKVLAVNPWDVPALTGMAKAAEKSGDWDCELFYLKCAQVASPKDPAVNRLCAVALTERGLIDQAIHCWHVVEEASPNDEVAKRAISILMNDRVRAKSYDGESTSRRPSGKGPEAAEETDAEAMLRQKIEKEPGELANYLNLAQHYLAAERYAEAEDVLAKAYEVSDGDVNVREKWEDAQLRRMRQKISRTKDPTARRSSSTSSSNTTWRSAKIAPSGIRAI